MHLAVTVLATTKMENEQSKLDAHGDHFASGIDSTNQRQPNDVRNWADSSHPRDRRRRLAQPSTNEERKFESTEGNARISGNDISMKSRTRRHAGGHHDEDAIELNPNAQIFVRKLFEQFGNGEQETMNVTGFEQMLQHLGLYRMIEDFSHNAPEPKSSSDSGITDAKQDVNTNKSVSISSK